MLDTISNPLQNDEAPPDDQTREPQSGDTASELLNFPIPENLSEMNCGAFIDWASNSIPKHGREKLFQSDITELISKLMAMKGESADDFNKLEDVELREKIASMHYVEFCWFARNFNFDARQYDLSQDTVNTMVEKYLQFADEYAQKKLDLEILEKLSKGQKVDNPRLITSSALTAFAWGNLDLRPHDRKDKSRQNIVDQVANAIIDNVKKGTHLEAGEKYMDKVLLAHPGLVQDETLFEAAIEMAWIHLLAYPPDSHYAVSKIKNDLFGWCVNSVAHGTVGARNFFKQKADELVKENRITDLARLVEMAKNVGRYCVYEGYDTMDQAAHSIAKMMRSITKSTDNYLMMQRAKIANREVVSELRYLPNPEFLNTNVRQAAVGHALNEMEVYYTQDQIGAWLNFEVDHQLEDQMGKHYATLVESFEEQESKLQPPLWRQEQPLPLPSPYPSIQAQIGTYFEIAAIAPGYIGIYNPYGTLERFVQEADVQQQAQPQIRGLEELDIFVPYSKTDIEVRHDTIQDTMLMLSKPFRKAVENDFGVTLSNLDIRVQQYFLNYVKVNAESTVLDMAEYAQKYGENFFTAFLSLEEGGEMGQVIERVCQKYDHETVASIFAKYAELVRASEQTRDYIRENYGEQLDANSDLENELIEQLLGRGQDILVYAASAPDQIDVVQYLEGAKTEIIMFANTFRTLKAHGERVDLEQFKKVHIERIVGSDLSDELKQQLSAISAANWAKHGVLGEKIQNEFEQLLSDQHKLEDTEFYQVLHENDILAFFRLDHYKTGLYFGSVNAQADLKGSKIGESLLEQIFKVATHDQTVRAHCSPKAPITSKYIGQFGFIATKIVDYAENADTFEIMRPKRGFSLELQGFSYDQLAARASTDQNDRMPLVRHYQFPDQYAQFVAEAQQYLGSVDPYAITAYAQRRAEHNKTDVMVGFERLPTHFGQENPEF